MLFSNSHSHPNVTWSSKKVENKNWKILEMRNGFLVFFFAVHSQRRFYLHTANVGFVDNCHIKCEGKNH